MGMVPDPSKLITNTSTTNTTSTTIMTQVASETRLPDLCPTAHTTVRKSRRGSLNARGTVSTALTITAATVVTTTTA